MTAKRSRPPKNKSQGDETPRSWDPRYETKSYITTSIPPFSSPSSSSTTLTSDNSTSIQHKPSQALSTSTPSAKMQYLKTLAITAFLAASVIASPIAEANPPKPTKPAKPPTGPVETNVCANGDAPYCCNTDNFGYYTTCSVFSELPTLCHSIRSPVVLTTRLAGGNICSGTTVCCNANNVSTRFPSPSRASNHPNLLPEHPSLPRQRRHRLDGSSTYLAYPLSFAASKSTRRRIRGCVLEAKGWVLGGGKAKGGNTFFAGLVLLTGWRGCRTVS